MRTWNQTEHGVWHCHTRVDKYHESWDELGISEAEWDHLLATREITPYDTLEVEGNLLVTVGINLMLNLLNGAGGTVFNNAAAAIGVGDGNGSVPTPAAGDTNLAAPTNKLRKGMKATYPTAASAGSTQYQSEYLTGEANFAWREWGIFNNVTDGSGQMLNHKGESLGTKASGTWTLTATITIT